MALSRPSRAARSLAARLGVAMVVVAPALGACRVAGPGGAGTAAPRAARRDSSAERDARRAEVRFPGGRVVLAEIADTPERTQRGYMFRPEVREGEGMVFIFPKPGFHPFWMKNTLVPLDIIWMDGGFEVIHIERSVPPCKAEPCPSYGPVRSASYVLEVRGGTAAKEGLEVGDRMQVRVPHGD